MKEANKKSKKKVLLTYLILAACLLVIAAITVTVIFTVGHKSPDLSVDKPPIENPDDEDKPNQPNQPNQGDNDDDNKPTDVETGYKIPVNSAQVSTRFEFALSDVSQYRVHQGIDFEGTAGDSVYAALDGTVTGVAANHIIGESYVTITHADGISTTYRYIDVKDGLKVGDKVKRGDVIGTISAASAGYEFNQGAHLHFEMKQNGKNVDPEIYLDLVEK